MAGNSVEKFKASSQIKVADPTDDLDDGLDYSYDSTADAGETVLAESEDEESGKDKKRKKRKSEDDEDEEEEAGSKKTTKSERPTKKKKSGKLVEKKQIKTESLADQKTNLAKLDSSMIADYIASKVRFKNKDLSTIELNEMLIPQSQIKDTSDFILERTTENFPKFIEYFLKELLPPPEDKNSLKKKKKPSKAKKTIKYILVLSQSALRVCDVNRALKPLPGGSLKLIKKNKLSYDQQALATGLSRVAVATAGRMQKLISNEMFNPTQIAAIVADSSFLDSKVQNIWDLADTTPFIKSLLDNFGEDDKRKPYIYLY